MAKSGWRFYITKTSPKLCQIWQAIFNADILVNYRVPKQTCQSRYCHGNDISLNVYCHQNNTCSKSVNDIAFPSCFDLIVELYYSPCLHDVYLININIIMHSLQKITTKIVDFFNQLTSDSVCYMLYGLLLTPMDP